jgi:hypothetical protein
MCGSAAITMKKAKAMRREFCRSWRTAQAKSIQFTRQKTA